MPVKRLWSRKKPISKQQQFFLRQHAMQITASIFIKLPLSHFHERVQLNFKLKLGWLQNLIDCPDEIVSSSFSASWTSLYKCGYQWWLKTILGIRSNSSDSSFGIQMDQLVLTVVLKVARENWNSAPKMFTRKNKFSIAPESVHVLTLLFSRHCRLFLVGCICFLFSFFSIVQDTKKSQQILEFAYVLTLQVFVSRFSKRNKVACCNRSLTGVCIPSQLLN